MSELANRNPVDALVLQVRSPEFREQLEQVLPENVSVDRFARVTTTALRENPDVAQDPTTLLASVIRCAQDGLLPDGHEAALVVFRTKDGPKVQYLPMIGGFRKIAAEHGWSIRTQVVREHDDFEYELAAPTIRHRRALGRGGAIVAAWALGVQRDGRRELEVMDFDEIAKVRKSSRTPDKGSWVEWFERMAEKTVGRRLFKKLPLGEADRERIVRVLDASDLGPAESAAALYGPQARAAFPLSQPEPRASDGDASNGSGRGEDTPSPEAGASSGAEAPASSDFDGEEPPVPPPAEQENDGVFLAGEVVFGSGRYEGRKISQVHEAGDPGYIVWAMHNWQSEPVKSAATTYAHAKFPELVKK